MYIYFHKSGSNSNLASTDIQTVAAQTDKMNRRYFHRFSLARTEPPNRSAHQRLLIQIQSNSASLVLRPGETVPTNTENRTTWHATRDAREKNCVRVTKSRILCARFEGARPTCFKSSSQGNLFPYLTCYATIESDPVNREFRKRKCLSLKVLMK